VIQEVTQVTVARRWGWRGARGRAEALYEARYGSEAQEGFKRVRVHDMRHTFGERLRAAGVTLDTVGDLLGHRGRGVSASYCRAQNPELINAVKCLESPKSPQWQRAAVSGYFGGPQSVEKQGRSGSYGWT
jgi:hypothetical protein